MCPLQEVGDLGREREEEPGGFGWETEETLVIPVIPDIMAILMSETIWTDFVRKVL